MDYILYCLGVTPMLSKLNPTLSTNTITGRVPNDKKSSPGNFSQVKPGNRIRIGCFGDSYTHGDEVNDRYDYPTLLQDIFRQHGYENVEVINFGVGGAGFHQAFNIWKFIGKTYNLDYLILGPGCFNEDRDSTFSDSMNYDYKTSLMHMHARYVLKGTHVDLIDVDGDTYAQKFKNYVRFLPYKKFLLYDRRPPAFLAIPLYVLLPHREFKANPFYYKNNDKGEMGKIYKILLGEMADASGQVILCHYDSAIIAIGQSLQRDNLGCFVMPSDTHFPYRAPLDHRSPNGNQFQAQILFDYLTGREISTPVVIETTAVTENPRTKEPILKGSLSEYSDIALEINHVKLGGFYDNNPEDSRRYCQGSQCESPGNTLSHTASLIAFQDNKSSMLDWVFLSLDWNISDGSSVVLRLENNGQTREFSLGKVRLLRPGLNIGIIDIGALDYTGKAKKLILHKEDLMQKNIFLDSGKITFLLQGIPVLSGNVELHRGEVSLCPVGGRVFCIRSNGREIIDESKLENTGCIYLLLESGQGPGIRVPVAQWTKTNQKVLFGTRIEHPLQSK